MVGVAGFEPATTRTPSECATSLRHTPTRGRLYIRSCQDHTRIRAGVSRSDFFLRRDARTPLHERSHVDLERPRTLRLIDQVNDLVAYRRGRHEVRGIHVRHRLSHSRTVDRAVYVDRRRVDADMHELV